MIPRNDGALRFGKRHKKNKGSTIGALVPETTIVIRLLSCRLATRRQFVLDGSTFALSGYTFIVTLT